MGKGTVSTSPSKPDLACDAPCGQAPRSTSNRPRPSRSPFRIRRMCRACFRRPHGRFRRQFASAQLEEVTMYTHARAPRLLIHNGSDNKAAAVRAARVETRGLAQTAGNLRGQSALKLLQGRLLKRGFPASVVHWIGEVLTQGGSLPGVASRQPGPPRGRGRGATRSRKRAGRFKTGNWRPTEKALPALLSGSVRGKWKPCLHGGFRRRPSAGWSRVPCGVGNVMDPMGQGGLSARAPRRHELKATPTINAR
jgi:hypothetical protein